MAGSPKEGIIQLLGNEGSSIKKELMNPRFPKSTLSIVLLLAFFLPGVASAAQPFVSITSPAPGTIYSSPQSVTITASASDNLKVTRVEFYDGTTLKSTDTSAPYSYTWSFTSTNNGVHAWTCKAYEASGQSTTSPVVSLTVNILADTTAPSIPTGLTATVASCSQINLSWTASTDTGGSGLAGYKVYRNGVQIATTS